MQPGPLGRAAGNECGDQQSLVGLINPHDARLPADAPCRRGSTAARCGRSCLTGMAKPTPALSPVLLAMAVFMPIIRPWLSSSGPPELPGLIAASIWIIDFNDRPDAMTGQRTVQAGDDAGVSVRSRPKGLPMAKTRCPTLNCVELPKTTGNNDAAGASIWMTATSVVGSWPISRAS